MVKRSSLNAKLSDINWFKANKSNLLSQQVDPNNISNIELDPDFELKFEDLLTNQVFILFSIKEEEETNSKKEKN